jgi:hypothetical protein
LSELSLETDILGEDESGPISGSNRVNQFRKGSGNLNANFNNSDLKDSDSPKDNFNSFEGRINSSLSVK